MAAPTITYPPIQGGGGGGAPFVPATQVGPLYEDWLNSATGMLNWTVNGGSTALKFFADAPDAFGVIALTATAGTQLITLGDNTGVSGFQNWNAVAFDLSWRFKLISFTDIEFYLGLIHGGLPFVAAIVLSYDTTVPDSHFMYRTFNPGVANHSYDSGIAVDGNWHVFRLRSITPGTLLFSLDGGAETSVTADIPTAPMSFVGEQINAASSSEYWLDWFLFQMPFSR